jgi:hypothetical protein
MQESKLEQLAWEFYQTVADSDLPESFSLWVELGRMFHFLYLSDPAVRAGWRKADVDSEKAA